MFAQVSTQCLFTCATNILGERKWDLICHIWMLLISYHPCMVGFVWIIYLMGDMRVRDQYDLFNIRFHNVFHNLFFYKPTCVVCYTIHNGGHYLLEHLQMFVLLEFYTIYRSMFVVFSCHNFLDLLTVFCHPQFLDYVSYMTLPRFQFQGTIYMLSLQILPSSFQPIFPFYPHPMSFEPTKLMIFDTYISLLDFDDNTNGLSKVSFMEYAWSRDIGTFGTNWCRKLGKLRID
jgi:hypothetical protein